jgi:N-acetylglucosaminyldiphosphoundecaprenol N-acetyl-beta-D-mannosaminyltransferase
MPTYNFIPNAQHILSLQKDTHFHEIDHEALLVVHVRVSLFYTAQFRGTPLKRVTIINTKSLVL